MTDIGFYHLTRTSLDTAAAKLLGRVLAAGQRALVLCPDAERVAALDIALWECPDPDWLPHGTSAVGDAALQPIWLTAEPPAGAAPNGAAVLMLVDATGTAAMDGFARVLDLFDGRDDAAVAAARLRWAAVRAAGHAPTYWQQTERGWERKA